MTQRSRGPAGPCAQSTRIRHVASPMRSRGLGPLEGLREDLAREWELVAGFDGDRIPLVEFQQRTLEDLDGCFLSSFTNYPG